MPRNNIQNKIKNQTPKLKKYLARTLHDHERKLGGIGDFPRDLSLKLESFVSSGKLMRGNLVLLSAGQHKDAYHIAAALELCHSMFLVHDDIIDMDLLRRGHPAIHALYMQDTRIPHRVRAHYGISQGICLGDIGFFIAFSLLSRLTHPHADTIRSFFMQEMMRVGFGEMQDVYFGLTDTDPKEDYILAMYTAKTARYSISLPVALGMYVRGMPESSIKPCITIGEYLGTAFQLKDDELGLFGDSSATGKGVWKDVEQNKKTILRSLLFSRATKIEKTRLSKIFGHPVNPSDREFVLSVCQKYNVRETAQSISGALLLKAEKLMQKIPREYKEIFEFIIDFNNTRIK